MELVNDSLDDDSNPAYRCDFTYSLIIGLELLCKLKNWEGREEANQTTANLSKYQSLRGEFGEIYWYMYVFFSRIRILLWLTARFPLATKPADSDISTTAGCLQLAEQSVELRKEKELIAQLRLRRKRLQQDLSLKKIIKSSLVQNMTNAPQVFQSPIVFQFSSYK